MTYNYKELNDIIKELSTDELVIAVIPDWVKTAKGQDRVLRAYVEHKPTKTWVAELYRESPSEFRAFLKTMVGEVKKKAITQQLKDGTADLNNLLL